MKKHIKMVLYAEPGVGKSTFASKAPNPYFITTDGNFEWLDLPDKNHKQVFSWEEAKKTFAEIPNWAETIVVDLVEDLFKWCEQEYCKRNKIEHISKQGYGQGYDTTRNEFFTEISKLLGLDKHVIIITHGLAIVQKDRRGVEFTKYVPSQRIPDKVWDMIEGRVRYFLRAFTSAEENAEGKLIKKRYLSIIPKENEFGISRGLDESTTPEDIALDWNTFVSVIGLDNEITKSTTEEVKEEVKKVEVAPQDLSVLKPRGRATKTVKATVVEEPKADEVRQPNPDDEIKEVTQPAVDETKLTKIPGIITPKVNTVAEEPKAVEQPKVIEQPQVKPEVVEQAKPLSQADKLAAIRAKLAGLKKN